MNQAVTNLLTNRLLQLDGLIISERADLSFHVQRSSEAGVQLDKLNLERRAIQDVLEVSA